MKVLIVGSGVAGICLAHTCLEKGMQVQILDMRKNVSSEIAAGIINPIVFRRMTLSWRVAELLPFAYAFYQELEQKLETNFIHPLIIRRLFPSIQERDFWLKKQELPDYQPFMEQLSEEDLHFPLEQNTFGTARVKQASYIDTNVFIERNLSYFKELGIFKEATFNYTDLNPITGSYQNETYDFIYFAEGKDGKYNPYFEHLPLEQTKGEVLTIQSDEIQTTESLNRKCFLLPIGNKQFKVGSTYVWNTDNTIPTEEGKSVICDNLTSISSASYKIVAHQAGVRPTVLDRRPLLGKHPEFPKLVIANGLGAKGYLLAPLLMHELVQHTTQGKVIDKEVLIDRFENKKA